MSSTRETISGALFLNIRAWIDDNHGRETFEAMVKALPGDQQELALSRAIVNTTRVPAAIWTELGRQAITRFGLTGENGFHGIARSVAMKDLSGYMKVLMKVGTPSFVLTRFPRVWSHYFSAGVLEVEKRDSYSGEVIIRDAQAFGEAALEGATSWMRAALAYAGAKEIRIVRTPVSQSESHYKLRWA